MWIYGVAVFFFVWLAAITYTLYTLRRRYLHITDKSQKKHIDEIIESVLEDDKRLKGELELIRNQLTQAVQKSQFYFQKLGIVRFNAFGKSGTDQSFVLALLDEKNNGMVINFIYTHDGVRIYPKKVKEGKGEEYPLSEEEDKAVSTSTQL